MELPSEASEDLTNRTQEDNGILNNKHFNNAYSTDVVDLSENPNDNNVPGYHYGRRGSRNLSASAPIEAMLQRRNSGHQINIGKRYSNVIPRRTAFMDNNIHRYQERLRETDERIKGAIENMPLTKYE